MEDILPRFSIDWIIEDELAISPILPIDIIEEVLDKFNTIVLLSPPSEFALTVGYNPQYVLDKITLYWLPIAKYNAPTLLELAILIEKLSDKNKPILVSSYRGCGRSAVVASSWLIRYKKLELIDSLLYVRRKRGCSVETRVQESVVRCYNYSLKSDVIDSLISYRDPYDPLYEYLVYLSWSVGVTIGENPAKLTAQVLGNPNNPLFDAAEVLKRYFNYRVFGITMNIKEEELQLLLDVWIPRKAHFSSIVAPLDVDRDAVQKILGNIILKYLGSKNRLVKKISYFRLIINEYKPREIPWY